ncbi:MAG: ABC transporter ATP-binding protein [Thermotogaceae bacterium]|nr:ABC transporter ATP-binding protein [Thermotogaceae bacterium]
MVKEFFKRSWKYYLIGVIALIFVDLAQLIVPRIMGMAIDKIEYFTKLRDEATMMKGITLFALWIMALATGVFLGRFVWRLMIIGSARRFEKYALRFIFDKLLHLDPAFFSKYSRGELMSRFTNDVRAVWRMLGAGVVISTDATFMGIMTVVMMGEFVSWKLTWIVIVPLLFITVVVLFFGKAIHKTFAQVQESFSQLSGFTEESISAVRIIKGFSAARKFENMFNKKAWINLKARMRLVLISGLFWPLVAFIGRSSSFLSLYFGGKMAIFGGISIGEFVSFNTYLGMLVWPMTAVGWVVNIVQQGTASLKRIEEILKAQPAVKEKEDAIEIQNIRNVRLDNLNFCYPDDERMVLEDVTLNISEGQFVGIVGTVGSGKSTLAKLILKLFPVERGRIYINSIDINDIKGRSIRVKAAYVPQEGFLFSDTIYRNVTLGENYDEDEVKKALKLAGILDEIESLPQGIYTKVGERGLTLSGGQRQRVMIARALVKKADLYIFDDCLSAVDPETEEEIINSLRTTMKDKTLVVITHRLKVLQTADVIYVLDRGKVVEKGTHQHLMDKKGLYYDMYIRQTAAES